MALNSSQCNHLMPLCFKGLTVYLTSDTFISLGVGWLLKAAAARTTTAVFMSKYHRYRPSFEILPLYQHQKIMEKCLGIKLQSSISESLKPN